METQIPLMNWLNCKDELLKVFSRAEIEQALKKSKLTIRDLTTKQDFQQIPQHLQVKELVKDFHTSNYIKVYTDKVVDGQHIQFEGYKTGQVITYRVIGNYQGLQHPKIIKPLLEKKFKWFNKFKWAIYGLEYSKIEDYEIYLTIGKNSLYVPLKALLEKDVKAIEQRNLGYWKSYRLTSSYDLNKNKGETLEEFKARKQKEYKKDISVLNTPTAKEFLKILEKK